MDLLSSNILSTPVQTPPPSTYHFKILVPAAAAGRIIGKGGSTIAQLQKDAGARVKMSKASEFYPGTTERVCLISGPIEGILKINDFFMENFSSTSIKILVPNSTAGMIIGKGGNYIKQIKEESGAYVQISQKCTDLSLPERCVTIVGEIDNIRKACAMILSKIVEDVGSAYRDIRASSLTTSSTSSIFTPVSPISTTNSNNCSQTSSSSTLSSSMALTSSSSYNHLHNYNGNQYNIGLNNSNGHVNNSNFTNQMSPASLSTTPTNFAKSLTPDHLNCSTGAIGSQCQSTSAFTSSQSAPALSTSSSTASKSPPLSSPTSNVMNGTGTISQQQSVSSDLNSAQIIESIKLVLRVSGYGEDAVSEISSAMSTLASYGVLGVGLGLL